MTLHIAFFGSSLLSAYWNGAATYYRGILKALAERGHRITFYEPDAYDRQNHRDLAEPAWARVVVYPGDRESGPRSALAAARDADVVVKASGVGVFDELLEEAVASMRRSDRRVVYWDVDAPATLDRLHRMPNDALAALIPRYDFVLTYGGGPPVVRAYEELGARRCVPIYNGLDPSTHHATSPEARFAADLAFLGNRLPDREARVGEFFFRAARSLPDRNFVLGGSGWAQGTLPKNVRHLGHVYTHEHNALNSSATAVLNISRDSMAAYGYSPATRVFEAAGAGACVITDAWQGVEAFFTPGREILVANDGAEVARIIEETPASTLREIGAAARKRALCEHTYAQRALDVEAALASQNDEAA